MPLSLSLSISSYSSAPLRYGWWGRTNEPVCNGPQEARAQFPSLLMCPVT